jgi:hypothetical protein
MKRFAIATLALGAALPLSVSAAPATGLQVGANGPNGDPAVWWEFVTNGPNGERQISPHFANEEDCERALKAVEALLTKRFPDRYPLVGSCEPYR